MKDALKVKILSLEAEVKTINKQVLDLDSKPDQDPLTTLELTKKTLLQACSAKNEYLKADDNQKSELLKNLLWNLSIENQNVQSFQLKQPFQLMAEAPKNMEINQWLDVVRDIRTIIRQTTEYIYIPVLNV